MRPKKANLYLLILLNVYCIIVFFVTVFLSRLGFAVWYYFKLNKLYFDWVQQLTYCVKIAFAGGLPTAVGVWILSKIEETKCKKEKTQLDKKK